MRRTQSCYLGESGLFVLRSCQFELDVRGKKGILQLFTALDKTLCLLHLMSLSIPFLYPFLLQGDSNQKSAKRKESRHIVCALFVSEVDV